MAAGQDDKYQHEGKVRKKEMEWKFCKELQCKSDAK
jgi:hypothetical protein